MLKFQVFYQKAQIQEWRVLYINYSLLKQMIEPFSEILRLEVYNSDQCNEALIRYEIQKNRIMPKFIPIELFQRLKIIQDDFVQFYQSETSKCNQFFLLHVQQIKISIKKLSFNLLILREKQQKRNQTEREKLKVNKNYYILRDSTKELYREAFLLKQFCLANRQASLRITKHYKKKAFFMDDISQNIKLFQIIFENQEINHDSYLLNQQIDDIENLYITNFSKLNPKKGAQILKDQTKESVFTVKNTFLFGSFLGVSLCLISMILVHRVEFVKNFDTGYDLYFPMFRGLGLFIFYFWLLACNVYIWEICHINYKQIFCFNFHHSTIFQIFKRISGFTMIFLTIFLLSIFKEISDVGSQSYKNKHYQSPLVKLIFFTPKIGPLIIWLIIIFYFVMPTKKAFNAKGRKYFWGLQWQCLISAMIPMSFPILWCSNQFVSFVGPFRDLSYTICFYYNYFLKDQMNYNCGSSTDITSGLIIACFPLILRMIQCVRQGHDQGEFYRTDYWYNFLKYTVSLMTAVFSYASKFSQVLFYAWVGSAFISMMFSYYWDIKKDWKFFQPDTKYRFLRKQLAYDSPYFYYTIILMNIILRTSWILSISPHLIHLWSPIFVYLISSLEIFRRFLWNFIRVEKEHVVNVGEFRAIPQVRFPYEQKLKKVSTQQVNSDEIAKIIDESCIVQRKVVRLDQQICFEEKININNEQSFFSQSLKEALLLSDSFLDDNEEEDIQQAILEELKIKVEKLNFQQSILVKKCRQDTLDLQQYNNKLI